ncbi:hypothetical protein MED121_11069 [Marinomonas sp. MED121]|uniref:5-oxoprolinase subunit PxpB n=1 Tax=Marinomonas sp. MED121 TaxID=314277 RepID=UPI0000690C0B|nr:5-oxoprolinase subunit PxpB [Marinomonas sp. MED121]EAQ64900.1 hypothetical protein MED121_11069 [Marinomonas sp. MED121]
MNTLVTPQASTQMLSHLRLKVAGEQAFILYFAEQTDAQVAAQIQAATQALSGLVGNVLIDLVPSYASLLVVFDDNQLEFYQARNLVLESIRQAAMQEEDAQAQAGNQIILPVYYDVESGPDLEDLARAKDLTTAEIIALHHQQEYRVYAIGFAPGFAYLGELDERLAAPRLATPRKAVPKGAVAIADRQTAVYPSVSPGGWNLIGMCPVPMFDVNKTPSMPMTTGDRIKFEPISKADFIAMGGEL